MGSFTHKNHGSFFDLSEIQKEKWFNDFKIVFSDDKSDYHGNKVLFAMKNNFFREKLADSDVVNIENGNRIQFKKPTIDLVTKYFMFDDADLNLDSNLVDSVLIFSDLINEKGLFNKCIAYMKNHMNKDNFAKFWTLAKTSNLDTLKTVLRNFVKKNFKKLYDEEKFLDMDYDLMTDILRSGKLNTDSEETVFFFLKKWLEHNTADRLQYYEPLIKLIRMKNLTEQFRENEISPFCTKYKLTDAKEFIESTQDTSRQDVATIENIANNMEETAHYAEFLDLSFDEMDRLLKLEYEDDFETKRNIYTNVELWIEHDLENRRMYKSQLFESIHLEGVPIKFILEKFDESQLENENIPLWKSIKKTLNSIAKIDPKLLVKREPSETLLVIGSRDENNAGKIEVFNKEEKKWQEFKNINIQTVTFASILFENKLLFIGGLQTNYGYNFSKEVHSFDFETKQTTKLPALNQTRLHATATVVDGNVYVCGGYGDGSALNTVEMWNSKSTSWTFCHPMFSQRQQHAATKWHRKLYVFGGISRLGLINKVEFYNPRKNKWTKATSMIKPLGKLTVSTLNDSIYIMGGSDKDSGSTKSVYIYHPLSDSWTASFDMIDAYQCFASVTMNEKIYTSGGINDKRDSTKNVYEFDPKTGKWSKHSEMNNDRYYNSMIVIPDDLIF